MTAPALRPFRVAVDQRELDDLADRLDRARFAPDLPGRDVGVTVGRVRELAEHWRTGYDWRRWEAELNRYPQYLTRIDGVDLHHLHVRSPVQRRPSAVAHPRLADVRGRVARPDRAADRARTGVRPGHPVDPGVRVLGRPAPVRLGPVPHRRGVRRADARPRLRPLRRARQRRRRVDRPRARTDRRPSTSPGSTSRRSSPCPREIPPSSPPSTTRIAVGSTGRCSSCASAAPTSSSRRRNRRRSRTPWSTRRSASWPGACNCSTGSATTTCSPTSPSPG